MKHNPNELKAEGYLIDNTCYPWVAYKGPRFNPAEFFWCYTDEEIALSQENTDLRRELEFWQQGHKTACHEIDQLLHGKEVIEKERDELRAELDIADADLAVKCQDCNRHDIFEELVETRADRDRLAGELETSLDNADDNLKLYADALDRAEKAELDSDRWKNCCEGERRNAEKAESALASALEEVERLKKQPTCCEQTTTKSSDVLCAKLGQRITALRSANKELRQELTASQSELQKIIDVAHKHGWNGVENSKILSCFIDNELTVSQQSTKEQWKAGMERAAEIADTYAVSCMVYDETDGVEKQTVGDAIRAAANEQGGEGE